MGLRGPQKTPTKILLLRGSSKAKHRNDPAVPAQRPPCPPYLSTEEKRAWRVLVRRLERAGLVTLIDGEALARYVVLHAQWLKAVQFVREHGQTYPVREKSQVVDGVEIPGRVIGIQAYPQAYMISKLSADLARIEASFGMTPSARASIGMQASIGKAADRGELEQGKGRFFA